MKKPVIICVDDEKIVLDSLKNELKTTFGKSYNIEVVENGLEAMSVYNDLISDNTDIPLIISDYIMPNMKGDELLINIHQMNKDTLKVMLTGQATTEGVTNVVNNGELYRFISKPWDSTDLNLTISEALRKFDNEKMIRIQNEEIKAKNQEIMEINRGLEEKVKERTAALFKSNEELSCTNVKLKKTIELLDEAKIGKKAATIIFLTVVALFLLIEVFVEPYVAFLSSDYYISLVLKCFVALLMKPLESSIELFLHKQKRKEIINSVN